MKKGTYIPTLQDPNNIVMIQSEKAKLLATCFRSQFEFTHNIAEPDTLPVMNTEKGLDST